MTHTDFGAAGSAAGAIWDLSRSEAKRKKKRYREREGERAVNASCGGKWGEEDGI